MKPELEKIKTRWRRFIGQKTRLNSFGWVDLLDSNWIGWAQKVLEKHSLDISPPNMTSNSIISNQLHSFIYHYYNLAIDEADHQDLLKLDNLYCQDYLIGKK